MGSNTQPTIQSPTSGLQTRTVEARQSQDSQSSSSREALRRLRPEGVVTDALSSDVCALRDSAKAHPLRGPSHPCPRPQSLSLEEKGDLGDTRYCLWGGLSVSRTASSAELVSASKVRRAPPAYVHRLYPSLFSLDPVLSSVGSPLPHVSRIVHPASDPVRRQIRPRGGVWVGDINQHRGSSFSSFSLSAARGTRMKCLEALLIQHDLYELAEVCFGRTCSDRWLMGVSMGSRDGRA